MLDTIVAISASGGQNAISIIRLCGFDALTIASKLSKSLSVFQPRVAQLSAIYSFDGDFIDNAIVIYFKAPNSFNGEEIVEIQCHGGKIISKIILQNCLEYGARLAEPGEFTRLAVLNRKFDISKAEAIGALINSSCEKSAKLLARQLQGSMYNFVTSIREDLIMLLAHCEVNIDYAEEDLPDNIFEMMRDKLKNIETLLQNTLQSSYRRSSLFNGLKIGIIGRPNVGKSSLLNAILEYERAIVSDIAGTTRDTIEEMLNIGEYSVKIVDTAGIRNSDDIIEQIGIRYAIKTFEQSDIVLALFDGSEQISSDDLDILKLLNSDSGKIILGVITKTDKEQIFDTSYLSKLEVVKISSKSGQISELEDKLKFLLDTRFEDDGLEVLINTRQINACKMAFESIKLSSKFLNNPELELFAHHIRESIDSIGSITSHYDNEEMLDKMFAGFCVGK